MLSALVPPIVDNRPKPQDPFEGYDFMKGFQDSEFYKKANRMQQDAVEFKFDGKDMMMNSSMAGALGQYLNSIGKGDLMQTQQTHQLRNLLNSGPLESGKKIAMIPEQGLLGLGLVGGVPLPEGVQIGFGPKRGGYFYGDGTPYNPPGSLGTLGPSMIGGPGPSNIANQPANNIGIGSLAQNPINTTPESNMTGSMTSSGYLNNNQDLDQYLNSYVENLINRRMRDIFGGIMSIFQ